MALPLSTHDIINTATRSGFNRQEANGLAAMASHQLEALRTQRRGNGAVTTADVAEALIARAATDTQRSNMTQQKLESVGVTPWEHGKLLEGAEAFMLENEQSNNGKKNLTNNEKLSVCEVESHHQRRKKFKFTKDEIDEFFGGESPYSLEEDVIKLSLKHTSGDIITALCQNIEIAVEIGKHLRPRDLLNLYSVSKTFHHTINGHLLSSVRAWVSFNAPDAGKIFAFTLYRRHLIPDPVGRRWIDQDPSLGSKIPISGQNSVRMIPGIKYVQLVVGRVRCCREIIAIMARNGHRLPNGMLRTLVRMWLLLEVSTTHQRQSMLRNEQLWTERDLYNAQFFFIKLAMHFNDPIYGPPSYDLVHLMLGQKGLYPLYQLLMRTKYTTLSEIVQLKVRYDYQAPIDRWDDEVEDTKIHGVKWYDIGTIHYEGWGTGTKHLGRPDELVPVEAVRRGLELERHLMDMVVWGYIDFETGENLVPTEDEMYISDDEEVLKHMDTRHHWRPKHALKKRWNTLTQEQRQEIMIDDEDERLRALAFSNAEEVEGPEGEANIDPWTESEFSLDDEIERGIRLLPRSKDSSCTVPDLEDEEGWSKFRDDSLLRMGRDPEPDEDQLLAALPAQVYEENETFHDWDWQTWEEKYLPGRGQGVAANPARNEGSSVDGNDELWDISDELPAEGDAGPNGSLRQIAPDQHGTNDNVRIKNEDQNPQAPLQFNNQMPNQAGISATWIQHPFTKVPVLQYAMAQGPAMVAQEAVQNQMALTQRAQHQGQAQNQVALQHQGPVQLLAPQSEGPVHIQRGVHIAVPLQPQYQPPLPVLMARVAQRQRRAQRQGQAQQ
ncbi:hypothetical protein QQX98_008236 [Neonectria punicea]|uniref:F-box domain-containing protein n=1 Tax=Neonectria punicea TaxID=979145 RepID=A0ABR1GVW8_9HYPO